jgi:hypothetical protein
MKRLTVTVTMPARTAGTLLGRPAAQEARDGRCP